MSSGNPAAGSVLEVARGGRLVESSWPYCLPFIVFLGVLVATPWLPPSPWVYPSIFVLMTALIVGVSRRVVNFRVVHPALSMALGIGVFAIWIAPDLLGPAYRGHWLFQNFITGAARSTLPIELRGNLTVLTFRFLRAAAIVPIIEELFWRAWFPRWIAGSKFWEIPMGRYTPTAFWLTAVLFASEHGAYWEVGLIAGVAYNWLMARTRSLGDCILAHALTNALLSAYVISTGHWEHWS
jgi:uncharacterized protein